MQQFVDEEVLELVYAALDDGLDSLSKGGVIPFAIIEAAGSRRLARFVAEPYEEGVRQARIAVAQAGDADRVLIAYDGFVTLEGARSDALLIEAQDRRRPHSVSFAMRYRPPGAPGGFTTIGDPAFIGPGDPLLAAPAP